MLLGCLGVSLVSLCEGIVYKNINGAQNRNFITFLYSLAVVIGLLVVSFLPTVLITGEFDYNKEFSFLYSKWFYFQILLECCGAWLYREAYYIYKDKYTVVNMFMFSTVFMMPIYAFIMNQVIDLNHDVTSIESFKEASIISLFLFIATVIYFYNKFKFKEIKDLKILVVLAFTMLNCLYFSTKLIQSYNGVLVYVFICLIIALNFLILAYKAKEEFKVIEKKKQTWFLLSVKPFMQLIYIKSMFFIPVELTPIVRRLSQLISGIIIDRTFLNKSESLGILIIVLVFVYSFIK